MFIFFKEPAHSYNISINNENMGTYYGGQKNTRPLQSSIAQERFGKQASPSQDEGSMTKEDLQGVREERESGRNEHDLQIEEVTEVISKVKNPKKKSGSSEIYIMENGITEGSYHLHQPEKNKQNTGHIKIELEEQENKIPSQIYSQFDVDIPEERPAEKDTDSEDINAVLGFTRDKAKNENDLSAKKGKKLKTINIDDTEEFPEPNSALNLEPQSKPQVNNEKITLTITSYKPKPVKEPRIPLQKSYDGLKNSIRSIEVNPMEKSSENFGGSMYSSGYHISPDTSGNIRNSKVMKNTGKSKPGISPKGGQTFNQRYFQPKTGSGKGFGK